MKKISFAIICVLILFSIAGCNSNDETSLVSDSIEHEAINEYIYPDYDRFNSPAKTNGLSETKVYLDGVITDVSEVGNYTVGTISESNNEWSLVFGTEENTSKSDIQQEYMDKSIRVFGMYRGLSEKTKFPVILVEKVIYNNQTQFYNIEYFGANTSFTENSTEKESEEPTTEMSDALHELYSDNNITLSYYQMHDYKYDPEEKRIEFCVENKTDKQLTIQSDLVSVNGISYKGNMSDKVLPNTKGIIEMNVYQKIPVDTPSSIGITINYFDGILGDTINEHGIVIPEIEIK